MATLTYDASQFVLGFSGPVSTTKNPDRIYFIGARTIWVGRIKGSSAILNATSDWGSENGMVMVSVDGGPFVAAPRDGSNYTLFDGEQDERLVCIRFSLSISQNVYINKTGTVLTVEGDDVGVTLFTDRVQFGEDTDLACFAAVGQPAPANYLPAHLIAAGGPLGSNIASAKVRGAFTEIAVVCASLSVYVSINGGEPTRYLAPETPAGYSRVVVISGLSGELTTYNIWTEGDDTPINYSVFAIYGDAEFQNIGTKKRIFQFGDRSTAGGLSGSTRGDVETMQVAAYFGYAGTTDADTAWNATTDNVSSLITTALAGIDATDDDVAILSVGRNESAALVSYQECVEKLLAGGFGTVLCRGVLPEGANVWPDHAATIQNVIATIGDPRVHFIDTSTWQPIDRPDGTNPSQVGFLELAEFAKVGYAPYLSSGLDYSYESIGGIELSGVANYSFVPGFLNFQHIAIGGIEISGNSEILNKKYYVASGGIWLSGSADLLSRKTSQYISNGGIEIFGDCLVNLKHSFVGASGVLLSGSADWQQQSAGAYVYVSSGGIVLTGDSNHHGTIRYLADSWLVVGGVATIAAGVKFESTGGIAIGGDAIIVSGSGYTAQGGILVGGAADYNFQAGQLFFEFVAAGGLLASGIAQYSAYNPNLIFIPQNRIASFKPENRTFEVSKMRPSEIKVMEISAKYPKKDYKFDFSDLMEGEEDQIASYEFEVMPEGPEISNTFMIGNSVVFWFEAPNSEFGDSYRVTCKFKTLKNRHDERSMRFKVVPT